MPDFVSIIVNVLLLIAVIFVLVSAGIFTGYKLGRFRHTARVMLVLTALSGVVMLAPLLVAPGTLGSLTGLGLLLLPFFYGGYRGVHLRADLGSRQTGSDESK